MESGVVDVVNIYGAYIGKELDRAGFAYAAAGKVKKEDLPVLINE